MKENVKWMGISNSFAAGVFLAIGLTHLLPEAHETFKDALNITDESKVFPIPFFICVLRYFPSKYVIFKLKSFSFILFIEKIAFDSHALMHDHNSL